MNIKVVNEDGQEEVKQEGFPTPGTASAPINLVEMEVRNMFGLKGDEEIDNIDTLIQWAKTQTDDHSPEGIKWAIRNIEAKTGTPPLGEKHIHFVSRYAHLALSGMKIEKELEKFKARV